MKVNGKEYKADEFIHFIRKKNGIVREIETKGGSERTYEGYDMIEVPFETIQKVSINTKGKSVPFASRNVINISRYLFWYWTPIIGSDAVNLYILLTEYCNDETDICFPKIKELAQRLGRSEPTIRKNLSILEKYNFIVMIHRLNKLANNKETSPIFKIRQTTPLLSKELYHKLPDYLKKKHDEFMEKYADDNQLDYFHYQSYFTVEEILEDGERIISKKERERIKQMIQESDARKYILENIPSMDKKQNEGLLEFLESNISKPTFEAWYSNAIAIHDDESHIISFIVNDFANEVLPTAQQAYERICNLLREYFNDPEADIKLYTHENYIVKLKKE